MCLTGHVLAGRLDSFDLDEEGRLGSFLRPVVRTPSSFPPASALNWIFVFLCFAFSSRALLPPCRRPPLWIELVLFNTRPRLKNTPFFSVKVWKCESVKVWKCESVKVWKCESEKVWKCESESVKHPPSSQDLFIWIDFGSKVWRILESTLSQTETWPSWQYFNFPSMEPNLQIGFEILGARERRSPKSKDTNWGQIGVEIPSNHFTVQQLWFFYLGAFTDTFTATWSHWKRKKMIANCRFQGWRCRMKPTCSISWGISLGARCSSEIPSHLVIWDYSPYSYIYIYHHHQSHWQSDMLTLINWTETRPKLVEIFTRPNTSVTIRVQRVGVFNFETDRVRALEKNFGFGFGYGSCSGTGTAFYINRVLLGIENLDFPIHSQGSRKCIMYWIIWSCHSISRNTSLQCGEYWQC